MTFILPAELVDTVISFIDERQSLIACSLVARDWVSFSRPRLFCSVNLTSKTLPVFRGLLYNQHSTIRDAVEKIRITGSGLSEFAKGDGWSKWVCDGFAELAPLLPRFSCLRLSYVRFGLLTEPDIPRFGSELAPLTQLKLHGIEFASFMQVSNLILAFPTLEDVSLHNSTWKEPLYGRVSAFPMRLRHLSLGRCYERDVVNWLLSQDPIPLIPHLSFENITPTDAPAIGQYLRVVGPSLTDLVIGFFSLDAGGDAGTYIPLSSTPRIDIPLEDFMASSDISLNTGLRFLCIDKFIHYDYQFSSAVPWILQLVQKLNAPGLETIRFIVYLTYPGDLHPIEDPVDWGALDSILANSPIWKLRSVSFKISGSISFDEAVRDIDKCLPRCYEAGILQYS